MGGLIKKGDGTDRNGNSNKWEKHKTLRPSVSVCGGLCNMEKHITICLFNENEEKRSGVCKISFCMVSPYIPEKIGSFSLISVFQQRYHHNKGIVREMSRIGLRNVFSRRRKSVDTPSPLGGKVQEVDDRPTVIQCAEQGRWGKCFEEVSREPSSLFDCDGQGQTLLHFAASSGNLSATQELLARGLEPSPVLFPLISKILYSHINIFFFHRIIGVGRLYIVLHMVDTSRFCFFSKKRG